MPKIDRMLWPKDHPDTARLKSGSRTALGKLEVQAARVAVNALPSMLIDAPSRKPAALGARVGLPC